MDPNDIVEEIEEWAKNVDVGCKLEDIGYTKEHDTIWLEIEWISNEMTNLLQENGYSLDTFESKGRRNVYAEFSGE